MIGKGVNRHYVKWQNQTIVLLIDDHFLTINTIV